MVFFSSISLQRQLFIEAKKHDSQQISDNVQGGPSKWAPFNARPSLCDPLFKWNSQSEISPILIRHTHSTNAK